MSNGTNHATNLNNYTRSYILHNHTISGIMAIYSYPGMLLDVLEKYTEIFRGMDLEMSLSISWLSRRQFIIY